METLYQDTNDKMVYFLLVYDYFNYYMELSNPYNKDYNELSAIFFYIDALSTSIKRLNIFYKKNILDATPRLYKLYLEILSPDIDDARYDYLKQNLIGLMLSYKIYIDEYKKHFPEYVKETATIYGTTDMTDDLLSMGVVYEDR